MNWVKFLFSAVGLSIVSWLGFVIVRFNLKRRRIIRAAAAATSEQFEEIYRLIEASGSQRRNGFVLGCLNKAADEGTMLHKVFHEGTFYLFGCKKHANQTRTVGQFS